MNIKPKMSFGGVGVLDVIVDGKTIFSHQAERRMPAPGEIAELVAGCQGSAKA
ncbi:MAG: hypothetical protein ACRD3A_12530 [Terriglobales bacterium]